MNFTLVPSNRRHIFPPRFIVKVGLPVAIAALLCIEHAIPAVRAQVFVPQNSPPPTATLFPVRVGSNWGYVDTQGRMMIEPKFVYVGVFSDGLAVAQMQAGGKIGFINKKGEFAVPPKFDSATAFDGGVAAVRIGDHIQGKYWFDGKWGLIDHNGRMVVEPKFDAISDYSEGLAPVRLGKKWGFIDRSGQIVIVPQYKLVFGFSEGSAPVETGGKFGFIDRQGTFVIPAQFNNARPFSDGLAKVTRTQNGDWGYIDGVGKLVIGYRFGSASSFYHGVAAVTTYPGGHACIDRTGQNVAKSACTEFSEGLMPVCINGKMGFSDETGKVVISPQWDLVTNFYGGIAAVVNFTKPGFQAGDVSIPGRLEILDAVGLWGYIDKTGKYIWKEDGM